METLNDYGHMIGRVFSVIGGEVLVVGIRNIEGEVYAQVKRYTTEINKAHLGEFALPVIAFSGEQL